MAERSQLDTLRVHRIDPRLVHATLLEAWVPYLSAEHVVVGDAVVASSARRRTIFEMSARDVGAIHFVAPTGVASLLASFPSSEPTIVVYGDFPSFVEALDGGLDCRRLLVGHLPEGDGKRRVHPSVYVGPEELEQAEQIRGRGVEVVVRPLPTDIPHGLRRGEDERPVLTSDIPLIEVPDEPLPKAKPSSRPAVRVERPFDTGEIVPPGGQVEEAEVEVVNERGLHLRAAHVLAQCASRFQSSVQVGWEGRMVNAKSLLGITTLGAARGTKVILRVEGEDATQAFETVRQLFGSGFEEGPA